MPWLLNGNCYEKDTISMYVTHEQQIRFETVYATHMCMAMHVSVWRGCIMV